MPHDRSISYVCGQNIRTKCAAYSDEVPPVKKLGVSVKSVQKWIAESDRDISMSAWLKYAKDDRDYVVMLKCSINEKLQSMHN